MAYSVGQIPLVDLQPSTALGVQVPFASSNVFTSVYTTKDQTRYNMINFLLTDRRERVFNPNFGIGLRRKLFEPMVQSNLDEIKQSIINQVQAYFPNVVIQNIEVVSDYESTINITFDYIITNLNTQDTVTIQIQNV
jgi:phage baseplate assembly protein W